MNGKYFKGSFHQLTEIINSYLPHETEEWHEMQTAEIIRPTF
jgi:hypothetical protein